MLKIGPALDEIIEMKLCRSCFHLGYLHYELRGVRFLRASMERHETFVCLIIGTFYCHFFCSEDVQMLLHNTSRKNSRCNGVAVIIKDYHILIEF